MIPKPKPTSIRARAGRAWDRAFGPTSITPPSSSPPTRGLPPAAPSPTAFGPPEAAQPSLSIAAPIVSTPTPAVPSTAVLPPPAFTLQSPSLRVPPVLQNPPPTSSGSATWSGLNAAFRTLHESAALFPSLQSVIGDLLIGFDILEASTRTQKEYETLALELKMMSETLDRHLQGSKAVPNMDFIVKIVQSIQEKVDLIVKAQSSNLGARLLRAEQLAEALSACDHLIQVLCRQLQLDAGLSMAAEQQNAQLEKLKPAKLAPYDSSLAVEINRRPCTENTRVGVLSDIDDWLADPDAPNVCWMNGMAGTGKTTIAYTLARALDKDKKLAASFFCTRTTAECQDVTRIVPTIAYQLARHSAPFLSAICGILRDDPDILSRSIATHFEKLLKDPLLGVGNVVSSGLVVVIDALDECAASNGVRLVLDTLLREAPNLPLKFFVTSRPEAIIRSKIREQPDSSRSIYELHNVRQSDVKADIELYLQTELPSVAQSQIIQLAEQSGSLFIYAATAVRYIRFGNIQDRLARMLSMGSVSRKGHAEIDKLYAAILSAALSTDMLEEDEEERMKLVLWTVVCARESISVDTLTALTSVNDSEKVLEALEPLRSVIYVSEDSSVVSPLHASFSDYIFSSSRSLDFSCDPGEHNRLLSQRCFELMREHLSFNICQLETSYMPDEMVPDLDKRIEEKISPTLAYVCRYWADHLEQTPASDNLHKLLESFLSQRLLFWMEVMNLKRRMGLAIRVMLKAKLWIKDKHSSSELLRFAEDAQSFVTRFAANEVSRCTPHLYLSHLPFCHQSSAVYKHYQGKMRGLIEPKGTGMTHRFETVIAGWNIGSWAYSVAYSPDGIRIALGCANGAIAIRDGHDGTSLGTPLDGHTDAVSSVVFSPDGKRIASASFDKTVRIWNARDGSPVGEALIGHTDFVRTVTFSYDNARIISGSNDQTIRIWSAKDGTLVIPPITGHTNYVASVACSPDGARIVSGSGDCTICIWNAQDGTLVGPPITGHTDSVLSVVFSPDGTRIVSGSWDNTICIWNVEDGTLVAAPLRGHNRRVTSVAFSPDGTRIVSGSWDRTIRMWDAKNGTPMGGHFKGHTDWVNSVAFSPDGTRVISAASDNTIRVWSARHFISEVNTPHKGHSDYIWSVAFSPDGTRVASGSADRTIRIWSAGDGSAVSGPLRGHTDCVRSIAFSPDGARIASGSGDKTIRVWNAQDGSPIGAPIEGHTGHVLSVEFSPDGSRIASGSTDMTVRMWNTQDGTPVGVALEMHTHYVLSVAFSPDGTHLASGSVDTTVCIWNTRDGTLVGKPLKGHENSVWAVAFSPDGTRIVSGSGDNTICIWSVQDGAMDTVLQGHTDYVSSIAFSPSGSHIVSGSGDRTICIWNAQNGNPASTHLKGHTGIILSVAFSPDGTRIVSGSTDTTIRMWDVSDNPSSGEDAEGKTNRDNGSVNSPPRSARILSNFWFSHLGTYFDGQRVSPHTTGAWSISKDGWVEGYNSRLIVWAPPDLAAYCPTPHNLWVIGPNGPISIDYTNTLAKSQWYTCYAPR